MFKRIVKLGMVSLVLTFVFLFLQTTGEAKHNSYSDNKITKISILEYKSNLAKVRNTNAHIVNKLVSKQNKRPFLLYFGYKECPYCRKFSPTLRRFTLDRQSLPVYYVNIDSFGANESRKSKLYRRVIRFINRKVALKSTPTIVGIYRGKIIGAFRDSRTTIYQLKHLNTTLLHLSE